MFGKFVLNFLLPFVAAAVQKGQVSAEMSEIYQEADFDAAVIAQVYEGEVYAISDNTKGPFYRIRLKDKRLGWISSVDIKPLAKGEMVLLPTKPQPLQSHIEEKRERNRFVQGRFQGPRFETLNWKEKTLGKTRSDSLSSLGWGWLGMDTMIEGPFYMDSTVTLAWQAPDYYKKVTGVSASGWMVKAQTAFLNPKPYGDSIMLYYGFGLSATFSHFEPGVVVSGQTRRYTAEDLNLGVVVPLGVSWRLKSWALSAWYRYYWEKQTYSGLSLGVAFPF